MSELEELDCEKHCEAKIENNINAEKIRVAFNNFFAIFIAPF